MSYRIYPLHGVGQPESPYLVAGVQLGALGVLALAGLALLVLTAPKGRRTR